MDRIKEILKLYKLYAMMDLKWFLQDRRNCLIVIASEFISNISGIAGVLLLSVRFGGVGGLTADEVLFMLGFYELANGFLYMVFGGNNSLDISRRVGRGQVDHMLIQPRPLFIQLATEGFMPLTGSSGFITGIVLTVIACQRLGIRISVGWLGAFVLYVACHMGLKIGQSFLYATSAFYKPVACEEISSLILDMNNLIGKYPLAGIPSWALGILTTILPVGLAAYVPALILLGKIGKGWQMALPVAVAAAFITLAMILFRRGLKHYAQYSCNRYKDMGHRC